MCCVSLQATTSCWYSQSNSTQAEPQLRRQTAGIRCVQICQFNAPYTTCTCSHSDMPLHFAVLPATWLNSCTVSSTRSHQSASQCRLEHELVGWLTCSDAPTTPMHRWLTHGKQWMNPRLCECAHQLSTNIWNVVWATG